ncbi:LysR family transcriptional regulator [Nocardioides aestuarii]|uniref:LysR family transcriptional regulator n=1 Tax=Nocardioides aestuarii TaxID=252231 RepID=A0ABW4TPF2_9ACTN
MFSLHQLRCFIATYEHGSLTAAAEELGYAQPSVSEQIRSLEKSCGAQLFRRVGRGVVPTTVADSLRPHAERTLAAAEEARRAVQRVTTFETGTIRFGMFGTARLYAGAGLVADVLAQHPGVRVELIGQNSNEVQDELRRGRLEAAMIAVPTVTSEGMSVTPVARDELVYISADHDRLASPVTARRLSQASLVMPETTWRADDSTRIILRQLLHETGRNPMTRIEVEDVETAVELVGMGLADSVIPRGAAEQLLPRLAPTAGLVPLRPRQFDTLAIVHRAGATLSPAARLMIDLATKRIQAIAQPVNQQASPSSGTSPRTR